MRALDDKVAIVTGGGGGIGAAIAQRFSREGAKVAIVDIDGAAAERCAHRIAVGENAMPHVADVTKKHAVNELVTATLSRWGRADILVNVAGGAERKALIHMTAADWDRVVDMNLKSVFLCCQAVLPAMVKQHSARSSIFPPSMVSPAMPPGPVMPRRKPVSQRLPNHWRSNTFKTALTSTLLRRAESKHRESAAITPMRPGPRRSRKFQWAVPAYRRRSPAPRSSSFSMRTNILRDKRFT